MNLTANQAVPESRAKQLFDALWPEFEKNVAAIPKQPAQAKHARPQPEILEELVTSVRSLDSRLREFSESTPMSLRHRRMRFHPMMVHEITHMVGGKPGDPIGLLLVASMLREDMPWLYELGMEAYRAARSGLPEEAERTRRQFQRAVEFLGHGPFPFEEIGMDPKMLHMLIQELEHSMMTEPPPDEEPRARARQKKGYKGNA